MLGPLHFQQPVLSSRPQSTLITFSLPPGNTLQVSACYPFSYMAFKERPSSHGPTPFKVAPKGSWVA